MKTSLPAMVFTCTLLCVSPFVNAGDGCAEEAQRNTELGHAIGVLVYNSIVKEYSEFATVEDIAVGLKHASGQAALSSKISIEADPDSDTATAHSLSVSAAQNIVTNWRPQSDQLGQRFLAEHKQGSQQEKNGMLTNLLSSASEARDNLFNCTSRFLQSAEENMKQVCYMQLQIDMDVVCDARAKAKATTAIANPNASWTYGVFDPDDVIEGWVEVFRLLEKTPLEREPLASAGKVETGESDNSENAGGSGSSDEVALPGEVFVELLEVVIPPELAYGKKGMVGKVEPDETLWFLMAVK